MKVKTVKSTVRCAYLLNFVTPNCIITMLLLFDDKIVRCDARKND